MSKSPPMRALHGNITGQEVDAIVNAANRTLLGGGGVDGAIHLAAGPALLEECRALGGCATGEAKITGGHRLPARHVIHTVGPVYGSGGEDKARLLASCYRRSLELASEHGLTSIAFPAISCGVYGYPMAEACEVAISIVGDYIESHPEIADIRFVLFSEPDHKLYQKALEKFFRRPG